MPPRIALYSGNWSDLPLQDLAERASEWGYQGLEIECVPNHLMPHRVVAEEGYASELVRLLESCELQVVAVSHQAAGVLLTEGPQDFLRHRAPEHLWGDGELQGVRQRCASELIAAAQIAQRLHVNVLITASGCHVPVSVFFNRADFLPQYRAVLKEWVRLWTPVLDAIANLGERVAMLVQPGQIVWDAYSADLFLEAVGWRSEVGLAVDTGAMYWHGADAAQFIRQFADRVFHVRITDVAMHLVGHNSVLSPLEEGDPRGAWDWRSPGRGQVDFEAILRALHDIHYDGALSVAWCDSHMEREFGAADASQFLRRLDFPARPRTGL